MKLYSFLLVGGVLGFIFNTQVNAGTWREDEIVSVYRQWYQYSATPSWDQLGVGGTWNCQEILSNPGELEIFEDRQVRFHLEKGILEADGTNRFAHFRYEHGALIGETAGKKWRSQIAFRIASQGDLMAEVLYVGGLSTYVENRGMIPWDESITGNGEWSVKSYYICRTKEFEPQRRLLRSSSLFSIFSSLRSN